MKKILTAFLVVVLVAAFILNGSETFEAKGSKRLDRTIPLNQVCNKTFLRDYILKQIPEGAKLVSVEWRVVYFNNSKDASKPLFASSVLPHNPFKFQWLFTRYYITNVNGPYKAWGTDCIAKFAGEFGPTTIHVSQSTSISNSFSANVGAKVVSAGLGFSVTASRTATLSGSLSIPSGKLGAVEVHPIYDAYNYDVVYKPLLGSPYKAGRGSALKAIGIFYLKYTWSE